MLGAAGPADAVDVVFPFFGNIIIDDAVHIVDVQAAGGHVCRHQHPQAAGAEVGQDLFPDLLAQVAVDALGGDALHLEQARDAVGRVLRVAEDDDALQMLLFQDVSQQIDLAAHVHFDAELADLRLVLLDGADDDLHRVPLIDPGDVHDLAGDGRGEHAQVLPVGDLLENMGHVFDKAHVQHPVGLVQHDGLDLLQADGAALHVVHEPAGGGHDDLGAFFQDVDLPVDGLAAVQTSHPDAGQIGAQLAQLILDLHRQLPRGGQDQAGHVRPLRVGVLHHGDAKGKRLAGAGGGLGDHVLPVLKAGDGPGLDGGGHGEAFLVQGLQNALGEIHFAVSEVKLDLNAIDFHKTTFLCPLSKGQRVLLKILYD